ncbi:hypothetical protein KC717_05550 [Candidatus Dojkabacteria bacterium]|uniref:Uncharacterized protein n=1 Tax=Candidatus Dojkabacteria bacterium TaxID=2099670 RepID=A0A955L9L1_9BACT|nr:hypothetical protein [Candidatus Dojkabacteria bacterium]
MNELVITKGAGKFIVLAAIVNIPFIGFIPYLTQAFTILFLAIFLKHMISDEEKISVAHSQKNVQYITKPLAKWLIYGTMAFQVLWIPYVMQLITLVALGIIYANFTKYKE